MEVGCIDKFVESNAPIEKLVVFAEDVPNLIDAGMEISFRGHLVDSNMEIAEHLVVDD